LIISTTKNKSKEKKKSINKQKKKKQQKKQTKQNKTEQKQTNKLTLENTEGVSRNGLTTETSNIVYIRPRQTNQKFNTNCVHYTQTEIKKTKKPTITLPVKIIQFFLGNTLCKYYLLCIKSHAQFFPSTK
jgi:alanine racemase